MSNTFARALACALTFLLLTPATAAAQTESEFQNSIEDLENYEVPEEAGSLTSNWVDPAIRYDLDLSLIHI